MASSRDTKLHQSQEAGAVAGSWQLTPGRALSLYPRGEGLLRITRGRAWVTLDLWPGGHRDEAGDHCLCAGEQLRVSAGRHLVFESLDPAPLWFEWVPSPDSEQLPVTPRALPLAQAWSEFWQSARLTVRALLRLVRGLLCTVPWLLSGSFRLRRR
jgi:hypothetical protein